jgi:outer membrane protein OmpA-like peptidoglycan-associated protein
MNQKAKKVKESQKSQGAYHVFFSSFVIGLTALILMSSFYTNDVSRLVKPKNFSVTEARSVKATDDPEVYTIRFDFESAAITPQAAAILNQLVKTLKADKTLQVNIEGHADQFFNEEYNLKISKERANNVQKYLLKHNIAKNRITVAFSGSSKPDPKNIHMPWLNRRADITVYKK